MFFQYALENDLALVVNTPMVHAHALHLKKTVHDGICENTMFVFENLCENAVNLKGCLTQFKKTD